MPGPLAREIAASTEEVQSLLKDNRSLSVAHLANLLRDLEASTTKRFQAVRSDQDELRKKLDAIEARVSRIAAWADKERAEKAG